MDREQPPAAAMIDEVRPTQELQRLLNLTAFQAR
jgi:hypothetical protein